MKNNASLIFSFFLLIGDFLALLAAFSVAYILRVKYDPRPLVEQIPADQYFFAFAAILPLWLLVHAVIGLYSQQVYNKRFSELGRLLVGSFLGILVIIGYDFVADAALFPARLVPVYALALGFGFLILFRTVARWLRRFLYTRGYGVSNVIIIGNTKVTQSIADSLWDVKISGQEVIATVGYKVDGIKCYKDFEEALSKIRRPIHSIIQTELYSDQTKNSTILQYAQKNHVAFRFAPGNSDLFVGNMSVELFENIPLISIHQTPLVGWGRIAKRLFDLTFSIFVVIALSPLLLLISLLLFVFDPGPIIFKQKRITRYSKPFNVLKFRTTKKKYTCSPEEGFGKMNRPDLLKQYRENGDFIPKDPRFTVIGRFLRKTSLDELPQLLNVIKGDISLVGPRALVPEEINTAQAKHHIVSVKSGITGLAQVSGRRDINFEERRRLDVYYVQNWSFWLDITLLLKTLRAVVFGTGSR